MITDEVLHAFMVKKKIFSKLGIEENYFFCDKDIYKKSTLTALLRSQKQSKGVFTPETLFDIKLSSLRQEKEILYILERKQ